MMPDYVIAAEVIALAATGGAINYLWFGVMKRLDWSYLRLIAHMGVGIVVGLAFTVYMEPVTILTRYTVALAGGFSGAIVISYLSETERLHSVLTTVLEGFLKKHG